MQDLLSYGIYLTVLYVIDPFKEVCKLDKIQDVELKDGWNSETYRFTCSCFDPVHSMDLALDYHRDYKENSSVQLSFWIDDTGSFWARLKVSFLYLFKKERLLTNDFYLMSYDRKELIKVLQSIPNE